MNIILNSEEIKRLIPHRYPFLFVDKVNLIHIDEYISATKNLSINEEFFQGHFPGHPVMPGVLAIEACAQTAGVLCAYSHLYKIHGENFDIKNIEMSKDFVFYLTSIDNTKFRNAMMPGDCLSLNVKVAQKSRLMWKFEAEIIINNEKKALETNFSAFIKSI
jgi:3-hydroxyacyl-[acyl-carrier-protein] dehydratase